MAAHLESITQPSPAPSGSSASGDWFTGFISLDGAGFTKQWDSLPAEEVRRRRLEYTSSIESIAAAFSAAEPLHWQGDGVMLFIRARQAQAAARLAFEAAKRILSKCTIDLRLQVRIAVHVARLPWNDDTGLIAHPAVDHCGHLKSVAPVDSIAVADDAFLLLDGQDQHAICPLGISFRDHIITYVYPAAAADRAERSHFLSSKDIDFIDRIRRYAGAPEVRRLRYAGFRLKGTRPPPTLDILDVFVSPMVRRRNNRALDSEPIATVTSPPHTSLSEISSPDLVHQDASESLISALQTKRAIVLLGDPGSGKTTALRWLATVVSRGSADFDDKLNIKESTIPILVSIGKLAEIRRSLPHSSSVVTCVAAYYSSRNVPECGPDFEAFLTRVLEQGRCQVLLDGLDEVTSKERHSIHRWLETFVSLYPKNRFVVTSRLVGYVPFILPDGVETVLDPFRDDEVRAYVSAFQRAYLEYESPGASHDIADEATKNFLGALEQNQRLSGLARSPFLLSALSLIHRAEGVLPRHRVHAYEILIRALCETWSHARRLVAGDYHPDISYEDEAVPILGTLAVRMHREHPSGTAPERFVVDVLAETLATRKRLGKRDARKAAEEFLRRAGEDVQILLPRGQGYWGFLHLTFQEFLAAVGLHAAEDFESTVYTYLYDPRWEEIIRLGMGHLALIQNRHSKSEELISNVFRHPPRATSAFVTTILRKHVPIAILMASETGDSIADQRLKSDLVKAFIDWISLVPDDVVRMTSREIASTHFSDRIADALISLTSKHSGVDERPSWADVRARVSTVLSQIGMPSHHAAIRACYEQFKLTGRGFTSLPESQRIPIIDLYTRIASNIRNDHWSAAAIALAFSKPAVLTPYISGWLEAAFDGEPHAVLASIVLFIMFRDGSLFVPDTVAESLVEFYDLAVYNKGIEQDLIAITLTKLSNQCIIEKIPQIARDSTSDTAVSACVATLIKRETANSRLTIAECLRSNDDGRAFATTKTLLESRKIEIESDVSGRFSEILAATQSASSSANAAQARLAQLSRSADPQVRELTILAAMTANAAQKLDLGPLLRDQNAAVRLRAIDCAEQLRRVEYESAITRLCKDPDERVRRRAVAASGAMGLVSVVPALVKTCKGDASRDRNRLRDAIAALWSLSLRQHGTKTVTAQKKRGKTGGKPLRRIKSKLKKN